MNKVSIIGVLARLKVITNSRSDSELARALGISAQTLSSWKVRDSIPYSMLLELALNQGFSLDWLILGEGHRQRTAAPDTATPAAPWEADLLEQLRALAPTDIQAIRSYADDKLRLQQLQRQLDELKLPPKH
ncbi:MULTISPECIES: helix-turn-helix domain-containing protein [unclassified Pseudomonas]|uniref:helix-turn-helix domain-containing protein n=1 Tax=unclassified Pseudomonas TaxID=196821 RepID=UPI0035C11D7C